jgi:hypothetical protein
VVVSCIDDAKDTYITGDSSLRMGMDVTGDLGNVWAFRFACSAAFSPLKIRMDPDSICSVTMGIGDVSYKVNRIVLQQRLYCL